MSYLKKISLIFIILLAISAHADYTTNVEVIEEVVTPASAPELEDALNLLVTQLPAVWVTKHLKTGQTIS